VVWAILRNPAYCGRAAFGKTGPIDTPPRLNRAARLRGYRVPRRPAHRERPRQDWGLAARTLTRTPILAAVTQRLPDFYAALARAYAERGAEMVLLVEDAGPTPAAQPDLTPLLNVLRYFRIPAVLLDQHADQRPSGIDLLLGRQGLPLLPPELLYRPANDAAGWRQKAAPLLATNGAVPEDLPAERLLEWIAALRPAVS
jgi:hypothetical protein